MHALARGHRHHGQEAAAPARRVWYAPGKALDFIWWYGPDGYRSEGTKIVGDYQPLVGDFDRNGYDDIYWYRAGSGADYLWMHEPGGTYRDLRADHDEIQRPGVGDLDGDGRDDLIWFDLGVSDPDEVWEFDGSRFVRHDAVVMD